MSLVIIHLTDIHMGSDVKSNAILNRKQQLSQACCSVLSSNDKVIIIISGDVAYSGKTAEYENAFDMIDYLQIELRKHLGYTPTVLMTPGNHDCDFTVSQSVRNKLLQKVDKTIEVDAEILACCTSVQQNFFDFVALFSEYDPQQICNLYEIEFRSNKILFQILNSSWMSQLHERPGELVFPIKAIPDIQTDAYDCIFTVMHHPHNWMHPDNRLEFLGHIRRTTDVLIVGHEHCKDAYKTANEEWAVIELHGKELQGDRNDSSEFSIYEFDDSLQNFTNYHFSWNGALYCRISEPSNMFMRNTAISTSILTPSRDCFDGYMDDPGMLIVHEGADNIRLHEIYCWPDLDIIEIQDSERITNIERINENVPARLLGGAISIVIGDSLAGKTAFMKMLFREYSRRNECCVLLDGKSLNTIVEKNLRQRIEDGFVQEYGVECLEKYRQLSCQSRILLIDNFNNLPYHDERRSKVLSYLSQYASHIIITSDNEIEMRMICAKMDSIPTLSTNYYRICYFGNSKRQELISKWYCLRNEYANGREQIDLKITSASEKINMLLGLSGGFIPAAPIHLINLLQNIDAVMPASFSGSQYGFLYDSLIQKSLSTINYTDSGALNIDISVLSALAFEMLRSGSATFSNENLYSVAQVFSARKKVHVDVILLLNNMCQSRLIEKLGSNTYKFRYPYIFYYFAGRYIAYSLRQPEVKDQISYMSQRLYNEKFGNIIIFVCHFANSIDVIDNILLAAYLSLEQYDVFDFDKHAEIFEKAQGIIDRLLSEKIVGTESDVEGNRKNHLEFKDKAGIQDGSISEASDISDEEAEKEKYLTSLFAAMRTLDVLGQIIKNYPGDIEGDVKISIIDEIHKLGMRITEALLSTIGYLEEDFIAYVIDYIREKKQLKESREIIHAAREMFAWLVAGMACGMIRKISSSLCNESLLVAVMEAFSTSTSISHKLILQDLHFNLLKKPNIEEAYQLAVELEKNRNTLFARAVLRSIVADYLTYNRCGYNVRAQLCARFGLSDKKALIEERRHSSQD